VAAAVAARTLRCNLAYESLADVIAALQTQRGIAVTEAITSGTPGFMVRARASSSQFSGYLKWRTPILEK
jgi:hypothetical protein